ncbi:hypothetical protein [Xenorhabdus stockiae]|uniref:hypothetical protein n=1 Tax=Xenorhabdus stockiae TaxID=351614 RepID=UPI004064C317
MSFLIKEITLPFAYDSDMTPINGNGDMNILIETYLKNTRPPKIISTRVYLPYADGLTFEELKEQAIALAQENIKAASV